MNLWILFSFINGFLATIFGFFVYSKNRKKLLHQTFLLMNLGVAIWSFSYCVWLSMEEETNALFWSRILNFGATLVPIFYLHWVLTFLDLVEKRKKLLIFGYSITFIFISFSFTPYYIKSVKPVLDFPYWPQAGPLYVCFLFLGYFGLIGYAIYQLFKARKVAKGEKRNQIDYIILASIVGFGGGATNFPLMFGISLLPPIGQPLVALYPFITTFAIIKYHLFEIRVLLTELLVGIMGLILFLQMIFAPTKEWKISALSIFLLFLIFGYLLIKYTHQEIKRKEELEEAYRKIEALSEMKSEFLKVVNHQLRTPFSIIRGLVSMMSEGEVSPERQKEFIQKLNFSVERLGTILDDILAAQSLVGGMEPPILSPCQIEEIVKMQVEHFKPQAEAKGIKISFKKPKEPLPITLADQQMIERIVSRLIDNAILYSEKGEIEVSVDLERENKKEWIKISVKDQGIGLDEKDKENLFKLFYRGEKATSMHPNGTGLALFIVKNYVESHRGKIEAKSEGRGKGSTFIVTLPVITEL